MSIESISSTTTASTSSAASESQAMGKDDFLMLLVTQLENQDPLNPMDGTEFTAQLAQFSSLELLQNISNDIVGLKEVQTDQGQSQAVAYLGKTVVAKGDSIELSAGTADAIRFDLAEPATSASATIYDSTGQYVRTIDLGSPNAGYQTAFWDGLDANGQPVADGKYSVAVLAMTAAGQTVEVPTYTEGVVTGVDFSSGDALLSVNGQTVSLADVRSMRNTN